MIMRPHKLLSDMVLIELIPITSNRWYYGGQGVGLQTLDYCEMMPFVVCENDNHPACLALICQFWKGVVIWLAWHVSFNRFVIFILTNLYFTLLKIKIFQRFIILIIFGTGLNNRLGVIRVLHIYLSNMFLVVHN